MNWVLKAIKNQTSLLLMSSFERSQTADFTQTSAVISTRLTQWRRHSQKSTPNLCTLS